MSFSSDTKKELSRIMPEKKCCMLAEIAGFIRVCGSIRLAGGGKFKIVTVTENAAVARHYKTLIREYFKIDAGLEVGISESLRKRRIYMITIGPDQMSDQILRETGIFMIREGIDYISDGIYDGVIKTKCCRKAYLRGLFLGAGSITNPEKGYHFEIVTSTEALANDTKKLINTFVDIHAKTAHRKKTYITYVKDSGQITDLLAIMGAHSQYFAFEDVVLTKEMRNDANRQSNCDQANIDKALATSSRQISAIKKIAESKGLRSLPEKLRMTALLRLENPEASLAELGEMMDPPMKKSGINKRLRRIEEIAEKI